MSDISEAIGGRAPKSAAGLWERVRRHPLARIGPGRTTGRGLAANIAATFPPAVLKGVVLALLVANTLNIAADVAAMGEVGELVTHIDRHLMTAFFVLLTLGLQICIPYRRYVSILKWLTLSLLAYAAVLFERAPRLRGPACRQAAPSTGHAQST